MRARWLTVPLALAGVLSFAPGAQANVGSFCGGWKEPVIGAHQSACYVRNANYQVAARGRAYYDGAQRLDQLSISVTLQISDNGTTWSNVTSRVCGFTDIADTAPGEQCLTSARWVEVGSLYRARTFLVLFGEDGSVRTTAPSFSPITS
jgi:hypothetical protein